MYQNMGISATLDQTNIEYHNSDIYLLPHSSNRIIDDCKSVINEVFSHSAEHYVNMNVEEYRKIVLEVQNEFNRKNFIRLICEDLKLLISKTINDERFFIQTNAYL